MKESLPGTKFELLTKKKVCDVDKALAHARAHEMSRTRMIVGIFQAKQRDETG
jgi:hypothetical protein